MSCWINEFTEFVWSEVGECMGLLLMAFRWLKYHTSICWRNLKLHTNYHHWSIKWQEIICARTIDFCHHQSYIPLVHSHRCFHWLDLFSGLCERVQTVLDWYLPHLSSSLLAPVALCSCPFLWVHINSLDFILIFLTCIKNSCFSDLGVCLHYSKLVTRFGSHILYFLG